MIGEFQYCSSSSEESDSELDSDASNSDEGIEQLTLEKKMLQDKIQSYEKKLMYIQKTLKSLNEERKNLLELRNKLLASSCFGNDNDNPNNENLQHFSSLPSAVFPKTLTASVASNTNSEPLNLNVPEFIKGSDIEEFDSDDEL